MHTVAAVLWDLGGVLCRFEPPRRALALARLTGDTHLPGALRTNAPLANLPAFAASFSCKPGQPMQRSQAEQIQIWP